MADLDLIFMVLMWEKADSHRQVDPDMGDKHKHLPMLGHFSESRCQNSSLVSVRISFSTAVVSSLALLLFPFGENVMHVNICAKRN